MAVSRAWASAGGRPVATSAGVAARAEGGDVVPRIARSPLAAMRAEPGVVAALLAATGLAWWATAARMASMPAGPVTSLGSVGWFAGVWATMMAAMMLPSLAPAAAAFATSIRRGLGRVLLFAGGYLLVWGAAGIAAYGLLGLGRELFAGSLAWHAGGRWLAAGVLALAALYQLTPLKRAFLARCRGTERRLDAAGRDTRREALALGVRNGAWCVGCTWAMMAALFALGVMSITWMGSIAALVALEKLGPRGRGARLLGAGVLGALAVAVLLAPHAIPGFVVPGSPLPADAMRMMG